jgi:hypothetical protein
MSEANQPHPAEQPAETAALLDALPGMVGGLDRAIFDTTGKKMPFMLVVFNNGGAMHATNVHPPIDAFRALKELAANLGDLDGGGDATG